ncbi:MAG: hypothetical protein WDW38_005264 [Sanguina aurantia]
MASRRLQALALCLTFVAILGSNSVNAAKLIIEDTLNPINCGCTDVDPHDSFLSGHVGFQCFDQARFGACSQPFMQTAIREIDEGYCQISCGRCDCCKSMEKILKQQGLNMFAWALNFTEYGEYIAMPGFMATLLAPTDDAMNDMLGKLGYENKEAVESDSNAKGIVGDIARYHILLPIAEIDSLWSAPFMRKNAVMLSAIRSGTRTVGSHTGDNGGQHILLQGAKSNASILQTDIEACKGFIQVLDTALIPFAMTGYN